MFGNKKCTATLAAGTGTCQFTITSPGPQILPASYGGDGNYDGSISANFSQNVMDFALSAGPAAQTVTPGSKVTYTLTVTLLSGFAATVSLACSGAPADSACTLSQTFLALTRGAFPNQYRHGSNLPTARRTGRTT